MLLHQKADPQQVPRAFPLGDNDLTLSAFAMWDTIVFVIEYLLTRCLGDILFRVH